MKVNIVNDGIIVTPFDETKPYIEITDEQLAKIKNGELQCINGILVDTSEKVAKIKRIYELKKQLADTDYQAIKFAECQLTAEEYAETKAQRQAWRDQINELED